MKVSVPAFESEFNLPYGVLIKCCECEHFVQGTIYIKNPSATTLVDKIGISVWCRKLRSDFPVAVNIKECEKLD